jgi:hypothetical protein
MRPAVLIIEPRHEVAAALEGVVNSANYVAMVRPYLDELSELGATPAAIIIRIAFDTLSEPAHAAIGRLPEGRPPIIAIASEEREVAEARRLKCDVVLRAPRDVGRLCEVLGRIVHV